MFVWLAAMGSANAQTPVAVLSTNPAVQWDKTVHDFGTIQRQVPQSVTFSLLNHSSEPIMITKAVGSCGCTVASYTEEMIAPGEEGAVQATYNAANLGSFAKTVTVTTSAGGEPQVLRIKGTVEE